MWPQVSAVTLRHVDEGTVMAASLCMCMFVRVRAFILLPKRHMVFFFLVVSNLMYFCIMARNSWETNKEEAFVQEQRQNKAEFLHLQVRPYMHRLCVALLA